ncbi:MAG: hypothetical protein ACI9ZV_000618 [Candidatus Azotimanducaceae bacterium]|jgi:hypothetical protein
MTALEKEIQKLPRLQRISIMEQIWADLSKEEASISIPDWHLKELEETEKSIQEGKEHFQDWETAKETIRRA